MMLLPFSQSLVVTSKRDLEMAALADGHYTRRAVGSDQFMPPGETLVLRNNEGTVVFGWLYQRIRDDHQDGICCTIFRNTSSRRSSEIILECEQMAFEKWGLQRMFTYVNAVKVRSPNPGYCFKMAGWVNVRDDSGRPYRSAKSGFYLLEKSYGGPLRAAGNLRVRIRA